LFFVLKFGNKFSKKATFLFTIILLIVLAHIFRYLSMKDSQVTTMEVWNTNIKSVVMYRFDTILYGVLLAWLHHFHGHFLDKYKVYFLILAAHLFVLQFVILNVLGVDIISCPIYFSVFYFTLSSMIFFLALPYFIFWKTSQSVFSRIISFVSKTSYAVYLIHYSIVVVVFKYVLSQLSLQLPTSLILFIYLGITFSLSYILYRFYEKPIMNLRDRI
jgi:peptidoglycan/LPS O-acetylase OafA/YrhL